MVCVTQRLGKRELKGRRDHGRLEGVAFVVIGFHGAAAARTGRLSARHAHVGRSRGRTEGSVGLPAGGAVAIGGQHYAVLPGRELLVAEGQQQQQRRCGQRQKQF